MTMPNTRLFVSDTPSAIAARDMIYANKNIFFEVVLPTQSDADMFYMEFVHAPAKNFVVLCEEVLSEPK